MMTIFRYSITTVVYFPLAWLGVYLGQYWTLACLMAIFAIQLLLDYGATKHSLPRLTTRLDGKYLTVTAKTVLYLHVPCTLLLLALMFWKLTPGDLRDVGELSGLPSVSSTAYPSWLELISDALLVGYLLSANTIVAHELVHAGKRSVDYLIGRCLLIINCDSQFTISHVYGHHREVGTLSDPATARRGENVYQFALRSTLGQYQQAMHWQRRILQKHRQSFVSLHNELLRGILVNVAIVLAIALWFSGMALMAYGLAVLFSKFLFETVNYIQHYGVVRVANTPVAARHSWDSDNASAHAVLYALTHHAHHHQRPSLPYYRLQPVAQQIYPNHLTRGYFTAILTALIPPVWFRRMQPLLQCWDDSLASKDELATIAPYQTFARHGNAAHGRYAQTSIANIELADHSSVQS